MADGEVVLGNDIPSPQLLVQRLNGVQNVLKAKLPNAKVVGPLDTKSEPTENFNAWKSTVQAHLEAIAFIGGRRARWRLPATHRQADRPLVPGGLG